MVWIYLLNDIIKTNIDSGTRDSDSPTNYVPVEVIHTSPYLRQFRVCVDGGEGSFSFFNVFRMLYDHLLYSLSPC